MKELLDLIGIILVAIATLACLGGLYIIFSGVEPIALISAISLLIWFTAMSYSIKDEDDK